MGWGTSVIALQWQFQLLFLFFFLSFFLPPKFCPTHFSATIERKSMKLHRNVKHYQQISKLLLEFSKWTPLPWKGPNCKKDEKHKNDHSKLLAEQKLMKLARNNIHIQWNEISETYRNRLDKHFHNCHGNKNGRIKNKLGFLSSNFIKLCRNIHRSV